MGKKLLYCASTSSHIHTFHLPYLNELKKMGVEIVVATNDTAPIPFADRVVKLPFQKSFFSIKNLSAISSAKKLVQEEKFDYISLHTTLASVIVRLGIRRLKNRPFVFQTVHGYLFSEQTPFLKKLLYLLPEKLCVPATDITIVMNKEDKKLVEKHHLSKTPPYQIHGMGVDFRIFRPLTKDMKQILRKKQGFSNDDFLFLYAAEFSKRKNQSFLIKVFSEVLKLCPETKLILAGEGQTLPKCKSLVKQLKIEDNVIFLGYRKDMDILYNICDVSVSTSKSEGLPFNIMEAMGCGTPIIASNIKGHCDLIENHMNGFLYPSKDAAELCRYMVKLFESRQLRQDFSRNGLEKIKSYSIETVLPEVMNIYQQQIL